MGVPPDYELSQIRNQVLSDVLFIENLIGALKELLENIRRQPNLNSRYSDGHRRPLESAYPALWGQLTWFDHHLAYQIEKTAQVGDYATAQYLLDGLRSRAEQKLEEALDLQAQLAGVRIPQTMTKVVSNIWS